MLVRHWYAELYLAAALLIVASGMDYLGWLPAVVPIGIYLLWQLWQLRRLLLLLDEPGQLDASEPRGLFGAVYDHIHRQQRLAERRERQLFNRIRRFEESSASLPDGVVSLDHLGNIEWVNAQATRLLGLSERDLGQRIVNVVRSPRFVELFENPDPSASAEMPAPHQSGIVLQLLKVSDGAERRLLVIRDVTQLRYLEQVRRDFVANASHELRTPLTVVSGYLEAMSADPDRLPQIWQQPIEQMGQQARRMQGIIADMLTLAMLESQQQPAAEADIAVGSLLAEVTLAAEGLSGIGHHLLVVKIDANAHLRGAEKELHSAVSNLVYNAVQHTPAGTAITLAWAVDKKGCGCLSVEDSGEGIPAWHINRLTERFYRIDADRSRDTGGTGLGLAIVKHIATLHGAELNISSKLGQGSRFELRFPPSRLILSAKVVSA